MDKNKLISELGELRKDIDEIDSEIAQLLCERYDTVLELSRIKRTLGIPLESKAREAEVLSTICKASPKEYASQTNSVFRTVMTTSKALQRRMLNLYFIGMPNCGKSRLACRIGEILGMPHVDADELVMQRSGKTIDRIFDEDGEPAFRELEHEVLCEFAYRGGMIVATGGGILTYEKNLPILKSSGFIVFLDRSIEKLAMAKVKNRPLIRDGAQAVISLYSKRIDSYRSAADLTVDPDAKGAVRMIIRAYTNAAK
ncbi:MAG: chorismate mutase [Clostridia bacterium]|nr:chorismate mutase [Clostridia bacterium]